MKSGTGTMGWLAIVAIALAGCSRNDDGGAQAPDGTVLASITLSPAASTIQLDGTNPAPIDFVATGTYENGYSEPLDPTTLTWGATRTDATPPGTILDGTLYPFGQAGGVVTVVARNATLTGVASVTFNLDVSIGDPGDPADWTGTPDTGAGAPVVVYPSDQTRFPRNIYRTLFQWQASGLTEFRMIFTGPHANVVVYTDGVHADCSAATTAGCWEADEAAWNFIAASNAGATATWTLDGLDRSTTPPTVRRTDAITLGFSKFDVEGAIFYWSTTSKGIRRANIADAAPEDYITGDPSTSYPTDDVQCVACHTVSRDGRYIAGAVDATSGGSLWIMEVTPAAPPNPLVTSVPNTSGHGFATISPDNSTLAVAWGGVLWTIDRATGAYIADIDLGGTEATHPDWSPDGTQLVFSTGKGDGPKDASVNVVPYMGGGTWGTPQTLVQSAGGLTNLFPSFSHDGKWLAFSRGESGGHGDDSAQLYLIDATGTLSEVELVNANRVVSNAVGDGQWENSLPTWAPSGDLDWVAFNSRREYGVVLPQGTQQIWVSAVDPAKAAAGIVDPSYPAFRLQFQGLNENNHRAFWTTDINDSPDNF